MSFEHTKHGYSLTFPNGYCLSVQFGAYHYGSNRSLKLDMLLGSDEQIFFCTEETTVEIAVIGPIHWVDLGGDEVMGWVTAQQVLDIGLWASQLPPQVAGEPRVSLPDDLVPR